MNHGIMNEWGPRFSCLVDEHQNDSHVPEWGSGEERESIGVIEKQISKSPIHRGSRWEGQSQHIEGCP